MIELHYEKQYPFNCKKIHKVKVTSLRNLSYLKKNRAQWRKWGEKKKKGTKEFKITVSTLISTFDEDHNWIQVHGRQRLHYKRFHLETQVILPKPNVKQSFSNLEEERYNKRAKKTRKHKRVKRERSFILMLQCLCCSYTFPRIIPVKEKRKVETESSWHSGKLNQELFPKSFSRRHTQASWIGGQRQDFWVTVTQKNQFHQFHCQEFEVRNNAFCMYKYGIKRYANI